MSLKPTKEQEKIFKFIKKRPENILIEAYAGAGKTTTIVEAVKLLPKNKNIMFMAFNKHIQEELKTRLPKHVRCYTSHGLGMSAIKRKYGDKIQFDEFKADKWIQKKAKNWHLKDEFNSNEEKYRYLQDIKKLVNLCRLSLTTDKKYIPYIADRYEIPITQEKDLKRLLKVLDAMTQDRSTFDYADMIYLPAIDKSLWLFPQDYVVIDECQDVNRAQQRLIEKMLKKDKNTKKYKGRLIAIGDGFQSIYGFTGITDRTYQWFKEFQNTKTLPLSYSFRCSKKVTEHAQRIVPNIKALPEAPEGCVRNGDVINETKDGDFVLSRTTTPLIKLFFEFLSQQKKAVIKGSDIGLQLIDLINNIKTITELVEYWNNELIKFKQELLNNGILNPQDHTGYAALEDKVNTLLYLAKISDTIEGLKNNIKVIFTDKLKGIVLSTIHKAKGLEADRVFIIRPDKIPLPNSKKWQYVQEKNLEYVAITRAKTELIYDHEWTDEE
jgi:DNA helicase-2/ATP-dependent DNA helicase PcrA